MTPMPPVAVIDSVPAYRRGLLWALERAGLPGEEPPDALAWATRVLRETIPDQLVPDQQRQAAYASRLPRLQPTQTPRAHPTVLTDQTAQPAQNDQPGRAVRDEQVTRSTQTELAGQVKEARHVVAAVLVTIRCSRSHALIEQLHTQALQVAVVALLPESTPENYQRVLRAGATAAAAQDAPIETVVAVLRAAIEGDTRLPAPIAHSLAITAAPKTAALEDSGMHTTAAGAVVPVDLTVEEVEWLRALARGTHVSDLARFAHCSKRAMFRLLGEVYTRVGASNRCEAVVKAERLGLLTTA